MGGYNFDRRIRVDNLLNITLTSLGLSINAEEKDRLERGKKNWNFYEGYHWEEIADNDKPQVTVNYCRPIVNKFVAFEFGNGFSIKMEPEIEELDEESNSSNKRDPLEFLNAIWEDNNKLRTLFDLGQGKSITGDGWMQVIFEPKYLSIPESDMKVLNPAFIDPFDEYEIGRIRILVIPSGACFPEYEDGYAKDRLKRMTIMYLIPNESKGLFSSGVNWQLYRQEWTNGLIKMYKGKDLIDEIPNPYGFIPFQHFTNYPWAGKSIGQDDLSDVIPINTEMNLKKSDVSEIIDYHSAPITVVFGARIGQLERGANKVWGGLPKDAKVSNLSLEGDLTAAESYINSLKRELFDVANIPEGALGGSLAISNTSGVALEISLMPLLERVKIKQGLTAESLRLVNKMILFIGVKEGLLDKPDDIPNKDFYHTDITFESVLPKDALTQVTLIEKEMALQLEDRQGAMKRLGRDNIQQRLKEIDREVKENPVVHGIQPTPEETIPSDKLNGKNKEGKTIQVNSGLTNSPTPKQK